LKQTNNCATMITIANYAVFLNDLRERCWKTFYDAVKENKREA